MMSLLFGSIYLIGAHGRSVYDWQHSENDQTLATGGAGVRPIEAKQPKKND